MRRKRATPAGWTSAEQISNFNLAKTTEILYPGSNSIALHEGDLVLSGGADGTASVYALTQGEVSQSFNVGSAITASAWWGDRAIVGTSAGAAKIFEEGKEVAQVGSHAGPVTSISVHPSKQMIATAGADKRFAVHELSTFKTVSQVYVDAEITCISFHVDGSSSSEAPTARSASLISSPELPWPSLTPALQSLTSASRKTAPGSPLSTRVPLRYQFGTSGSKRSFTRSSRVALLQAAVGITAACTSRLVALAV
jgi:WD40 repeat protein